MVYWSKTKTLEALNSTGRAPRALTLDYFSSKNHDADADDRHGVDHRARSGGRVDHAPRTSTAR